MIDAAFWDWSSVTKPIGNALVDKNIGKNNRSVAVQDLPDHGIIFRIDRTNDAEDSFLHIHSPGHTINISNVRDIITNNACTLNHGSTGLTTSRGKCTSQVGLSAACIMNCHEKHMLRQPALTIGLPDCQPEREFFQANGVAGILSVIAVDRIGLVINCHTTALPVNARGMNQFTRRVQHPEDLLFVIQILEILVATPVQQVLTVSHIE